MRMTTNTALVTSIVAIASAIIGVLVAAGLPLSKDLQDHVLTLITVATPAVLALIALLHHGSAKVAAAKVAAK